MIDNSNITSIDELLELYREVNELDYFSNHIEAVTIEFESKKKDLESKLEQLEKLKDMGKVKHQINMECELCHLYVIFPIEQVKEGGLFLDNLKCINCQSKLILDLAASNQ